MVVVGRAIAAAPSTQSNLLRGAVIRIQRRRLCLPEATFTSNLMVGAGYAKRRDPPKLEVDNRTQAIVRAQELGLLRV